MTFFVTVYNTLLVTDLHLYQILLLYTNPFITNKIYLIFLYLTLLNAVLFMIIILGGKVIYMLGQSGLSLGKN